MENKDFEITNDWDEFIKCNGMKNGKPLIYEEIGEPNGLKEFREALKSINPILDKSFTYFMITVELTEEYRKELIDSFEKYYNAKSIKE